MRNIRRVSSYAAVTVLVAIALLSLWLVPSASANALPEQATASGQQVAQSQSAKPDKLGKSAKSGKQNAPDKQDSSDQSGRLEQSDKQGKSDQSAQSDQQDQSGQLDKALSAQAAIPSGQQQAVSGLDLPARKSGATQADSSKPLQPYSITSSDSATPTGQSDAAPKLTPRDSSTHTVSFVDPQGGTVPAPQTVVDGNYATWPATEPTHTGYAFDWWYLANDPYNFNLPVHTDLTLTAHWERSEASMTPNHGPTAGGTHVAINLPKRHAPRFVKVSGSRGQFSLGIGMDRYLYAWGLNDVGQLGIGTAGDYYYTTPLRIPITMPSNMAFTDISAGVYHGLAADSQGHIYSWGDNEHGQLGIGSPDNSAHPSLRDITSAFPAGVKITQVSAGVWTSMCIDSTGRSWAWGYNNEGQLGVGYPYPQYSPMEMTARFPAGTRLATIKAGLWNGAALDTNGHVWEWGDNQYGQIGLGFVSPSTQFQTSPLDVTSYIPTTARITSIDYGNFNTFAIDETGHLWGWGWNDTNQIGTGNLTDVSTPFDITSKLPGNPHIVSASPGDNHSLAIDDQGHVYAWGSDEYGQLGFGTINNSNYNPIDITPSFRRGTTVASVVGAGGFSLALDTQGKAWGWGFNNMSMLGNGNDVNQAWPVQVGLPTIDVTQVTFGGLAGSNLAMDVATGTWWVDTPAHPSGPVTVLVKWTLNGTAQTDYSFIFNYDSDVVPMNLPTAGSIPLMRWSGSSLILAGFLGLAAIAVFALRARSAHGSHARKARRRDSFV
ncbi:hypothetical protein KIM372_12990 [Bombiscardovia nodaiensis]|uniref:RCC1-like domain-containing protein n=1 Tax=Bombiscardovia nodaiensis TaxID=2932181 RepID=A0ABM8B922_9BIFI|nr:hypothetical protein KIM372_12990 [Bombiscardovia nodaiensis]